jgi:aminoglycoside phosphotransferase (APT) family kinase protein
MSAPLEPEILAALGQAGLRARSFVCISNILSPEIDRTAYRIDHEQGTIKARRLENEPIACRLFELRRELPDAFAPVLLQHGRVLLEDWIDGEALPDIPAPHQLAAAGALLGELHARPTLGRRPLHEVRGTAHHHAAAEQGLRHVVATSALREDEAERLARAMQRLDPHQTTHGLVHFDFCGENMVIDRAGRLRVVDNERIGLDAIGFDLARAWYRWALPAPAWEDFYSAYAARLPFSDPLDSLRFWQIVAAARAASLRLRAYPERADVPIACLRALAAEAIS